MALSCFALQVPDVRVATRVPGLMLHRDFELATVGTLIMRHSKNNYFGNATQQ